VLTPSPMPPPPSCYRKENGRCLRPLLALTGRLFAAAALAAFAAVAVAGSAVAESSQPAPVAQVYTLESPKGGWTALIKRDGTLDRLSMTFGGKRVEVPWRHSSRTGPSWEGVSLSKTNGEALVFEGRSGDRVYSIAYRDEEGEFTISAGIRNEGSQPLVASPRVRFALGIDHEMKDPASYFTIFFPTLLRCEKSYLWGYFQSPNGQVLAIASKEPVASWALGYLGGGHRIATSYLDVLHVLPLPARHPQNAASLAPGEARTWRFVLHAVDSLDQVAPTVAKISGVPAIALDRTAVAPGETVDLTVFSGAVTVPKLLAVDNRGNSVALPEPQIDNGVWRYRFPAPDTFGALKIQVSAGDRQSEAIVYVRKPWGWYLQQARSEALRMQQKPGSHREGWLGFFSDYLAQAYFPDAARLAETEKQFKEFWALMVDPATGHFFKKKQTWADRPQNSSWMLGLLVARFAATRDPRHLEQAAKWGDLFIEKYQNADGAFAHGKNSYAALTLGSDFLTQLAWFERPLAAKDIRWKECYERHLHSVERALGNLETVKDIGNTEGEQTYEDNQAGSAWSLLALHALTTTDAPRRARYLAESREIQSRHESLTQALIPDGRMRGGTLRFWEAQYDVLTKPNMMNSPHGWTMRSQFGALYLYLLTGEERYLNLAFNAMGACAQAIDVDKGVLRWAFVPDPYVSATQFVPDPTQSGGGRGVPVTIGEQWLPMISDWYRVPPGQVAGHRDSGWSCDNDVHEHFRIMASEYVPNAFVLERADGTLGTWNCRAQRSAGRIMIVPAEAAVSRVHLNLRKPAQIVVQFASGAENATVKPGMTWVGPGLRRALTPDIYLWNEAGAQTAAR